jgi:Ca2+-binding RTX toxin-like protein
MSSNNLVLYVAFIALALVSRLGGGIDQIAFAQLPPYSPPIENQNQNANANNLPLNNNPVQPTTPSIRPNCMNISSSEGGYVRCGTNQNQNQNQNTDNLLNNNTIQPSNTIQPINVNKNPVQTSNVKHGMSSDCLAIPSSVGRDPTMSFSSSKTLINCNNQNFFNSCPPLVFNGTNVRVPTAITIIVDHVIKATSLPSVFVSISEQFGGGGVGLNFQNPVQKVCGTNDDNYIVGSEGDDIIFGLRGNDIITALGGDDLVFGGPGDDIVYGNDGNNQLFGNTGNDNLVGGTEDDLLVGGPGNDRLYGNAGDDILQGGPGADYFDCGDGVDTVVDYNSAQGDIVSVNCENVNSDHSSTSSDNNNNSDTNNNIRPIVPS